MLVTVLMSVYNGEAYLDKAIDSILNQTYKDFEFIIIDDGSTDKSKQICEKYASADNRIVFIENEKNLGLPASLNKGILLAKGTYIARQDADDYSVSDRLAVQLAYAKENSWADMIGSDCYVIDIAGDVVFEDTRFSACRNHKESLLKHRALFPHGSAFVKKEKLIEVGLYDVRFYYVQDGELWLRMLSKNAKVLVIDKPLYYYRTAPIANTKRLNANNLFNKVLDMMYAKTINAEIINQELTKINFFLKNNKALQQPNYMANYWKSLGNASYFNHYNTSVSFNYLKKAISESNSYISYPKYLMIGLMYLLPASFIKQILNLRHIA